LWRSSRENKRNEQDKRVTKNSTSVVIVSAARTPVGSFSGTLSSVPAHLLGRVAIEAALARAGLAPDAVEEVILGQILTAGQGQNPARQAAIAAGIPADRTAFGINQLCGSGLRAVALAAQQVRTGESGIVVAGGQESMSQAQHAAYLRSGARTGALELADTMLKDGLWEALSQIPGVVDFFLRKWFGLAGQGVELLCRTQLSC
jgi:acetyl-CoA C-acetyltransferase